MFKSEEFSHRPSSRHGGLETQQVHSGGGLRTPARTEQSTHRFGSLFLVCNSVGSGVSGKIAKQQAGHAY